MNRRTTIALLATLFAITAIYERLRGRVWWCQQHDWNPISIAVNSPHNSQHLIDTYSFSHVLHGLIFFAALWFARNSLSFNSRLFIATVVECIWEMTENSPFVIERYRAATSSFGYAGDSIANSLGDVFSTIVGFYLARLLGLWKSIATFAVIEIAMLVLIRDNLTLNVIMLIHPVDSIRQWQLRA